MNKAKTFFKLTLFGGLAVILPITIIFVVFRWLYFKIVNLIQPLIDMIPVKSAFLEFLIGLAVVLLLIMICFLIGLIVKTGIGKWIHEKLETKILKFAPGYNMVKETIMQFLGRKKSPFSSVAMVQIFENRTLATAFVTDQHEDGSVTVFVPTGPNPTSGQIFHLEGQFVHPVDVPVEEAMRSIISCGAGSTGLMKSHRQSQEG